jgi:hypothetical protein
LSIPFLPGDIPALEKTGLTGWFEFFSNLAIVAAVLVIVAFGAMAYINRNAQVGAERMRVAALQGEGLTNTLWMAKPRALVNEFDFKEATVQGDLHVYIRPAPLAAVPTPVPPAVKQLEVVIQKNGETVSIVNVVKVHDRASWALASDECVILDGEEMNVEQLVDTVEFRNALAALQTPGVDVIFVGLESYPTSDYSKSERKDLSHERARALGIAVLRHNPTRMEYAKGALFYGVGLGRAVTPIEVNTPQEMRQRAVIMLTVSRRQTKDEAISIFDAFAAIIRTTEIEGTNLGLYAHSQDAAERLLTDPLDFGGYVPNVYETRPHPAGVKLLKREAK